MANEFVFNKKDYITDLVRCVFMVFAWLGVIVILYVVGIDFARLADMIISSASQGKYLYVLCFLFMLFIVVYAIGFFSYVFILLLTQSRQSKGICITVDDDKKCIVVREERESFQFNFSDVSEYEFMSDSGGKNRFGATILTIGLRNGKRIKLLYFKDLHNYLLRKKEHFPIELTGKRGKISKMLKNAEQFT